MLLPYLRGRDAGGTPALLLAGDAGLTSAGLAVGLDHLLGVFARGVGEFGAA